MYDRGEWLAVGSNPLGRAHLGIADKRNGATFSADCDMHCHRNSITAQFAAEGFGFGGRFIVYLHAQFSRILKLRVKTRPSHSFRLCGVPDHRPKRLWEGRVVSLRTSIAQARLAGKGI